jgi:NAD(P)-dependent dehydrogenase (short-subunit alcohol dehydrogenase family)
MSAGKVVFVTGAASGIGQAAAELFAARGWRVALADRNDAAAVSEDSQYFRCDVTDDDSVRDAVADTVRTFGRLDAAFNAAGIDGEYANLTESTMENWNRVIAVDLTGTFSCLRHEIPAIVASGGGSIVNCASTAGLRAAMTVSAYTAAKHGVVGLTKVAAKEYGRAGVRINAIAPGTVDTPMFQASLGGMADKLASATPVGRLAQASEIADVAVWLCDEAPGYLTGEIIAVDGGMGA